MLRWSHIYVFNLHFQSEQVLNIKKEAQIDGLKQRLLGSLAAWSETILLMPETSQIAKDALGWKL